MSARLTQIQDVYGTLEGAWSYALPPRLDEVEEDVAGLAHVVAAERPHAAAAVSVALRRAVWTPGAKERVASLVQRCDELAGYREPRWSAGTTAYKAISRVD